MSEQISDLDVEPWLRGLPASGGTRGTVHPVAAHTIYTFQQTQEELARYTSGLETAVWAPCDPLPTLGFQIRHITGSVDRLTTYLEGLPLAQRQLSELERERVPGPALTDLLQAMDHRFAAAESIVRLIPPSIYLHARVVGRRRLPTTVAGLMIHISEHTQRHLGQAVLTAKLLRARSS